MSSAKTVLITGASGFIGSHVSRDLTLGGFDVYASEHIKKNPEWVTSYPCDLRYPDEVLTLVHSVNPDIVVHLASQPIVQTGEEFVRYTFECNVQGTLNLYDALLSLDKTPVFIGASTDKVYGRTGQLPYTEDHELRGNEQAYETSKTMQDHMMQYYSRYFPTVITRCSNVYGPGDTHESRIVPHAIKSCLQGKSPTVRSNGQQYRDYMFIDDVVYAYRACVLRALEMNSHLEIYNFGTGVPSRVLDVVSMIREHFVNSPAPEVLYGASDEISKQYNSYDRANQVLGWIPSTKLKEGISKTIDWWRTYERD